MLRILIQSFNVSLENGITILIARISIHELIIDGYKAECENGVVSVSPFVPHQMLLYDELLQHGVVDAWDGPLVSFEEIRLRLRYRWHI